MITLIFFNPGRRSVARPRGMARSLQNKNLACPTPQTNPFENKRLFCQLSNPKIGPDDRILEAARWFAKNCENRTRAFIPLLRDEFGLTPLEAIKAAQLARDIEAGEAR